MGKSTTMWSFFFEFHIHAQHFPTLIIVFLIIRRKNGKKTSFISLGKNAHISFSYYNFSIHFFYGNLVPLAKQKKTSKEKNDT